MLVQQVVLTVQVQQPRNMYLARVLYPLIHNSASVRQQVIINTNQQPVLRVLHHNKVQLEQRLVVVMIVRLVRNKQIVSKGHGIIKVRIGFALIVLPIHIQHQVIRHVPLVPPIRIQQLVLPRVLTVLLVKLHHREVRVVIVMLVKPQPLDAHVETVLPTNTQQQVIHLVPTVLLVQPHQQVIPLVPIVMLVKLRQQVMHVAIVLVVPIHQQVMPHVPTVPMVNTQQQALLSVLPIHHVVHKQITLPD